MPVSVGGLLNIDPDSEEEEDDEEDELIDEFYKNMTSRITWAEILPSDNNIRTVPRDYFRMFIDYGVFMKNFKIECVT